MKRVLTFLLILTMIFALPVFGFADGYDDTYDSDESPNSNDVLPDWEIAMNRSLERIVNVVSVPDFGSVGGEWAVLAVARSNFAAPDGWIEGYLARIGTRMETLVETPDPNSTAIGWVLNPETGKREVRLSNAQSTENARLIVTLTSLGVDASNFTTQNGYAFDLVSRLGNRHNATSNNMWGVNQGINGPIWNLIALNSRGQENPYEISDREWIGGTTESNPIALVERIGWILDVQMNAGGWDLTHFNSLNPNTAAGIPDPDITAMAIQSLAPYYNSVFEVREAVDTALEWLSENQLDTGGWASWGTYNVQSVAQVIVALTALGINPQEDERFIAESGNPISSLLSFQDEVTGGFIHGGEVNLMATEQAAYALVAYWRFRNEINPLYDMSDAFDGNGGTIIIPVDRTELNAAITQAESRNQSNYTSTSWTIMQTALAEAIEVYENEDATQLEINEARDNLTSSIIALVRVGGGSGLPGPNVRRATISIIDPNARVAEGQTRVFFALQTFDLEPNETAYSLLRRTNLNIRSRGHSVWAGMYVEAINNFGEFDDGPLSGWMYRVNGVFPDFSSSLYELQDGDRIEWLFTRDLGRDIGGGWIGGGGNPPSDSGSSSSQTITSDEDDEDEDSEDADENADETGKIEETTSNEIEWENPFKDVSEDSWFYHYVRFAYTTRLMTGVGNSEFSPNINITRAMLITMLHRLAAETTVEDEVPYTWYSQAVSWAMENGISDGSNLQDNITREQIAVMLYRFMQYKELQIYSEEFIAEFTDIDSISNWALESMEWANSNGLITGRTLNTLAPQGNATRAETAAILQRFIEG